MASELPSEPYNLAVDLLERNLPRRAQKTAFIDADGEHSYAAVAIRANRFANVLRAAGVAAGDRVLLCLLDGVDFVAAFLGAIKAGVVPVPLNTLLTADDYRFVLADSTPRAAIVAPSLLATFQDAAAGGWNGVLMVAAATAPAGVVALYPMLDAAKPGAPAWPSRADDVAFWLYSSGSTGRPKGVLHRQASPYFAARLFAGQVLGLISSDVVYSAAKLFFAYGLGNALFFPISVGATTVLLPDRPTPDLVTALIVRHGVTVFCGVPTLYAGILNSAAAPAAGSRLRLCLSAGESLPQEIGEAWVSRTGCEIVDGIGSTEMLHIYVSNRPGSERYGTTGIPVPGYDVKLLDETGEAAAPGEVGELFVRGPTMAVGYWNHPDRTAETFRDGWMKTGDKFRTDADGVLVFCGRSDDMLKVGGIWVSPAEVENALLAHAAVAEAAVIGAADSDGLIKTKAFVVVRQGFVPGLDLERSLQAFVKTRLAPFKYPRSIVFVAELPKTATGKIRRHVLRDEQAGGVTGAPA